MEFGRCRRFVTKSETNARAPQKADWHRVVKLTETV